MIHQWKHRLMVVFGCATVASAVSWPLLPRAGEVLTSGRATSDLGYAVFAQWWMGEALAGRGSFFDCPLVYAPDGQNLAASVWNVLALAITGPLHWFAEPVTAWNLSILLIATLNGVAAFVLGHRIGGRMGGIAASAVVLCSPWMWMELFEGRIEQGLIAPMALYIWALIGLKRGQSRAWISTGITMGLVGATYWFMAILGAIATLPILGRRLGKRDTWMQLLKAAGVSILVALPFFLLVAPDVLSDDFAAIAGDAKRTFDMRVTNSVSPLGALVAHVGAANLAFPLVVVAGLGWSLRLPQARPYLAALVVVLILAAGPVVQWDGIPVFTAIGLVPLPLWGLDIIPGFGRFIWPYRVIGIGILVAACAIAVVAKTLDTPLARQVGAVALALLMLEGHNLTLKSAAETDAQLPITNIDPPADGAFFRHDVPEWMHQVPAESGSILTFPLAIAHGWAPLFIPIHQHALTSGDGSSEMGIQPNGFRDRLAKNRLLAAWESGGELTPDMATEAAQLQEQGLSWVVQFRSPNDPEADELTANLSQIFGPPVHKEAALRVWGVQ